MAILRMKLVSPVKPYDFTNSSTLNRVSIPNDINDAIVDFNSKSARRADGGQLDIRIFPTFLEIELTFKSGITKSEEKTIYANVCKFLYNKKGWNKVVEGKRLMKNI